MIQLAIEVAAKAHRNQTRKGTDIPYISHPYAVGIMLLREGSSEDIVSAGILHDTIEDTWVTLEYINRNFGEKVAEIVAGCSEPDKSLPWEDRKIHTLKFLKTSSPEIRIVACADKLHNIRSTYEEYKKVGEAVWTRFNRGRDKQLWYYTGLVDVLCNNPSNPQNIKLFDELKREVNTLFGITS